MTMMRALLTTFLICMLLLSSGYAVGQVITAPEEVEVRAVLAGSVVEATGKFRVLIPAGSKGVLSGISLSAPAPAPGRTLVEPGQISVPAVSVSPEVPWADVTVSIRNLSAPGIYIGQFQLQLTPEGTSKPVTTSDVALKIIVGGVPTIDIVPPDRLVFNVSNCNPGWTCWLTDSFVPGIAESGVGKLSLSNKLPVAIEVIPSFQMMSTNGVDATTAIHPNQPVVSIGPKSEGMVSFKIDSSHLNADNYRGKVMLEAHIPHLDPYATTPPDGTSLLINEKTYPIELQTNVRDSVIWAIGVAFLGVVVGRLASWMNSPVNQARLALYPHYIEVRGKVQALTDLAAAQVFGNQLQDIYDKMLSVKGPDQQADDDRLTAIELSVDLCARLQGLTDQIRSSGLSKQLQDQLVTQVQGIRAALLKNDVKPAQDGIQDVLTKLAGPPPGAAPVAAALALDPVRAAPLTQAAGAIQTGLERLKSATPTAPSSSLPRSKAAVSSVMNFLAGTSVPLGAAFWFARPAMFLVLLVVLTIYGVWLNYVGTSGSAATFGSQGVGQYAALFLWGISTEIVNKTLQNISFAPKPWTRETIMAIPCTPENDTANKIAQSCETNWAANNDDCNKFVKAALGSFLVAAYFDGLDADGIVGKMKTAAEDGRRPPRSTTQSLVPRMVRW